MIINIDLELIRSRTNTLIRCGKKIRKTYEYKFSTHANPKRNSNKRVKLTTSTSLLLIHNCLGVSEEKPEPHSRKSEDFQLQNTQENRSPSLLADFHLLFYIYSRFIVCLTVVLGYQPEIMHIHKNHSRHVTFCG